MLPQYARISSSNSTNLFVRRSFRTREKCLILLVFLTLGFVCFGGFFYLPDNFGAEKVLNVYKQFQRAGPEIFIPAPPHAHGHHSGEDDPHGDKAKLQAKIQELNDFLEKPETKRDVDPQEAPLMNAPSPEASSKATVETPGALNFVNGEDADPIARQRRNKVKEVI